MIGAKGTYYTVQMAISDPRQREVLWGGALNAHKFKADAISAARQFGKNGQRVRVMMITEECVWANNEALVAAGEKVS